MIRLHRRGCAAARDAGIGARAWIGASLALAIVATAASAELTPGSAQWSPRATARTEPPAAEAGTTLEAEGLYSYSTPFAPPRWIRIQQAGEVVWGSIDINDAFGMCTRARFDGTLTGDHLYIEVSLAEASCPCSGPGAMLTFEGTMDGAGGITGTWWNNCTPPPPGSWWACTVPETTLALEGAAEDCPLPENSPPTKIRQTPAAAPWAIALLAAGLAALALGAIRLRDRLACGPDAQA